MSSLSTSLKNSYQKFCQPYEEYLKVAKPGVYMQLEMEKGGPFTPSPGASPMKKSNSQQATPSQLNGDSPAALASNALNAHLQHDGKPASSDSSKPPAGSFTPVNSGGGFTAVNGPTSAGSSFTPANATNGGAATGQSTPVGSSNSPMPSLSAKPTSDFRSELPPGVMTNGQFAANQLKRQLSNDQDNGDEGGRRSKRLKKDHLPTVTGSQMTQPRTSTPRPRPVPKNDSQEKHSDVRRSPIMSAYAITNSTPEMRRLWKD
jgi:[histone H3]-trimethyl-L-lysine4 demethylase